jgi:hypothetical protein
MWDTRACVVGALLHEIFIPMFTEFRKDCYYYYYY